jgi:hypothetical protein
MSEPFLERLSRFTPDAGGLNRDALLFAAGRNSARPNRRWMSLAGLMAGTQVLTLVLFFWPPSTRPGSRVAVKLVTPPAQTVIFEPQATEAVTSSGVWTTRQSLLDLEAEDRPPETVTLIDSEPPARAFAPTFSN